MDWQEAFSLIFFLLLAAFSKKRKSTEANSQPSPPSDIEMVRKKIEALKQQRNNAAKTTASAPTDLAKKQPKFSAYKHLPSPQSFVPEAAQSIVKEKTSKDSIKSIDLPHKKSRLRNWVLGQVILGTPAYRRYGSFIHR